MVNEAGAMISRRFKRMLMSVLDLSRVSVEDIMVPRGEINAIDLDDDADEVEEQLILSQHTRLPVCRGDINNVEGVLHVRKLLLLLQRGDFDIAALPELCDEPSPLESVSAAPIPALSITEIWVVPRFAARRPAISRT